MIHFEVPATDMEAAVALVIQAGAMVAPHQPADRDPAELRVVLDPAGHPFCLCAANLVTIMYAAWDGVSGRGGWNRSEVP